MPPTTNSGIVTDATSGERHIPESVRPDGTTRKAIKIRPGFRPMEDVELYRARNAVAQRERRRVGIPGVEAPKDENTRVPDISSPSTKDTNRSTTLSWRRDDDNVSTTPAPSTSASNKNAKRREARRKAESVDLGDTSPLNEMKKSETSEILKAEDVDPEIEREKKVRNLKKKLKQAKELKNKKDEGQGLLPEQVAKVIKINELIRELSALGFDDDGEVKKDAKPTSNQGIA
ncbi:hypothetical protein LLEC1_02022 [Akanthomyces lecanii]|uniref:WIBG Mago-binding domain-containing protein n=1 Tax=Cordyceps confragosa TaxID=2714763 RepID=A0A179I5S4_CORDF|nr:hypothetical protein LLEC1_02022 [Akanthomyces lecanii]